jgi:hypothetical protein
MIENIQPAVENYISIFVPMTIKKRGGRGSVAIITLPHNKALPVNETPNYDYRLINGLIKAHKLQKMMAKNSQQSISSLARKEGLTHAYLGRILRLNLLAPGIVEAILAGKQPKDLRMIDLMRKEIPLVWEEQREKFGFV